MTENKRKSKTLKSAENPTTPSETKQDNVEKDPAAEWGGGIETGKQIARGGHSQGHVPGASEQKP